MKNYSPIFSKNFERIIFCNDLDEMGYFVSAYAKPLYQTLAVLLLAYVVLFVSTAIGSVQSVLRQVNPNLEDTEVSV